MKDSFEGGGNGSLNLFRRVLKRANLGVGTAFNTKIKPKRKSCQDHEIHAASGKIQGAPANYL